MRSGILYGIGAYGLWGLFPLYFSLLDPAAPPEVLAHRIVWSALLVVGLLAAVRRLGVMRRTIADPRSLRLLALAAVLIGVNWGTYIYAVTDDRVLEAALGYFITPLVSVAFGVARLRGAPAPPADPRARARRRGGRRPDRLLRRLPVDRRSCSPRRSGATACVKKLAGVGAAEGLAVETLVLLLPAAAFLALLGTAGEATFANEGLDHGLLLAASRADHRDPAHALRGLRSPGCR